MGTVVAMRGIELRRNTGARLEVAGLAACVGAAQADAERLAAASLELEGDESLMPEARLEALVAMRAEMDAARAEFESASEELRAAFEAISMCLGSDEQIVLLHEGEPAPADTPIHSYQTTLFMDEEMALAAEEAGIEDATIDPGQRGWASFDAWLLDSDAHVDQVCPAVSVVVSAGALGAATACSSSVKADRP